MSDCAVCTKHQHQPDDDRCTPECRTRQATEGNVCRNCAQQIRNNLDTIPDCYALSEEPNYPNRAGDGRSKAFPLPGGTEWIDYRSGVDFQQLDSWIDCWCDHYGLAGPKTRDLTNQIGWLRAHLTTATTHPAINDFAGEMSSLARRGLAIIGALPERGQRIPCPTDQCEGTLRVRASQLEDVVRCKRCGIERSSAQLLTIAMHSASWVPLQVAAETVGRSSSTVWRWAERGKINRTKDGYWLPDVIAYATRRSA